MVLSYWVNPDFFYLFQYFFISTTIRSISSIASNSSRLVIVKKKRFTFVLMDSLYIDTPLAGWKHQSLFKDNILYNTIYTYTHTNNQSHYI